MLHSLSGTIPDVIDVVFSYGFTHVYKMQYFRNKNRNFFFFNLWKCVEIHPVFSPAIKIFLYCTLSLQISTNP